MWLGFGMILFWIVVRGWLQRRRFRVVNGGAVAFAFARPSKAIVKQRKPRTLQLSFTEIRKIHRTAGRTNVAYTMRIIDAVVTVFLMIVALTLR